MSKPMTLSNPASCAVATQPTIRAFLRAQADFQELMNGVNRRLADAIGLEPGDDT